MDIKKPGLTNSIEIESVDVQTPPSNKLRLNKSIKQCPHCKRVDHQRRTSDLCPNNNNINHQNLIEPTVNVNFENGPISLINTNLAAISDEINAQQFLPNSDINSPTLSRKYSHFNANWTRSSSLK